MRSVLDLMLGKGRGAGLEPVRPSVEGRGIPLLSKKFRRRLSSSNGAAATGEQMKEYGSGGITDPRVKASCMRCIVDYIQFCQKLMILPDQLELVEVRDDIT